MTISPCSAAIWAADRPAQPPLLLWTWPRRMRTARSEQIASPRLTSELPLLEFGRFSEFAGTLWNSDACALSTLDFRALRHSRAGFRVRALYRRCGGVGARPRPGFKSILGRARSGGDEAFDHLAEIDKFRAMTLQRDTNPFRRLACFKGRENGSHRRRRRRRLRPRRHASFGSRKSRRALFQAEPRSLAPTKRRKIRARRNINAGDPDGYEPATRMECEILRRAAD